MSSVPADRGLWIETLSACISRGPRCARLRNICAPCGGQRNRTVARDIRARFSVPPSGPMNLTNMGIPLDELEDLLPNRQAYLSESSLNPGASQRDRKTADPGSRAYLSNRTMNPALQGVQA